MRQERTIQATIFDVFAQHEIGCELKAMPALRAWQATYSWPFKMT